MVTPGILFSISIKPLIAFWKIDAMPSQAALAMLDQPPMLPNQSDTAFNWSTTHWNASVFISAVVQSSQ
ncbi:hypothetical protein D3C85_1425320 [compost metagenome]